MAAAALLAVWKTLAGYPAARPSSPESSGFTYLSMLPPQYARPLNWVTLRRKAGTDLTPGHPAGAPYLR